MKIFFSIPRFLFLPVAVLLSSCAGSSLQPLVTKPPAKTITLTEKVKWGDGFLLKRFEFYPAKHTPKFEDKTGYYFVSEQKVFVHDALAPTMMVEGGIFWKKGDVLPKTTYSMTPLGTIIRQNHDSLPLRIEK